MKKGVYSSLRLRLLMLIMLALLPAFVLIIYKAIDDNRKAAAEVKTTALAVLRAAAKAHEQLIDDAHDLLALLSRLPVVLLDPPACHKVLMELLPRYPKFANFLVVDPAGAVVCSVPIDSRVNYADRPWFKATIQSRTFVASEYFVGRVTTKPTIAFSAPVIDGAAIKGVVSVSAQLDSLNRLSDVARLPANSTFTILDRNGTVLVRQPDPQKWIGNPDPRADLLRALLAEKKEGMIESNGADGVDRLFVFKPLGAPNGIVSGYLAVGIPRAAAYREARTVFALNLTFMTVAAALVLTVGLLGSETLVLRPIRSLVRASTTLGKGDLSARTGSEYRRDEIGQLAGAFDRMAEALQEQETDRRKAERTRAQLAAIVESSSDAIVSRDLDGKMTSWNKGAEILFGYSAEEMIGNQIMLLVPQDQIELVKQNFERIKRGERIDSYETVRLKKGGIPIDVSVTVSPIIDDSGKVIGASTITRDIGARKRSENELKALHVINLAISSTLERQAILEILLAKIETFLPYAASHIRLLNTATGNLEPVACRNLDEEQWKQESGEVPHAIHRALLQSARPLTIRDLQTDERISRREFYRQQGLVSYLGVPLIVQNDVIGVLSLLTKEAHEFSADEIRFAETLAKQGSIAIYNSRLYEASKILSDELAFREERIRILATGLIHTRDEEAKRIANVLHDESGQFLAMVYISLDELAKNLAHADRERIREIKGLLDKVEQRLRDLSHELHPAMLDHLGLLPSLEYLADQTAKRAAIEIAVDGQLDERLSPILELTIYRVVQEAFNNIVRHAGAKSVHVRVLQDNDLIQCAIQDDGVGFDSASVETLNKAKREGLGLAGMRERVEAIGGIFQILSAPGQGTKLFFSVPRKKANGSSSSPC